MSLSPETLSPRSGLDAKVPALAAAAPATHAILRIGAALLMIPHGAQKLFGVLGKDAVPLFTQYGFAGVVEFFGGILIALGLLTRSTSALMCLLMIAAYFVGHAGQGALPILNRGETALLYALIFAFVAAKGAGPWSLDGWLRGRRGR
jgi:putative oxidoreductase